MRQPLRLPGTSPAQQRDLTGEACLQRLCNEYSSTPTHQNPEFVSIRNRVQPRILSRWSQQHVPSQGCILEMALAVGMVRRIHIPRMNRDKASLIFRIQLSGHLSASAEAPWVWSRSRGSPMGPCASPGHPEADLDTARPGLPACMFDSSTLASLRAHQPDRPYREGFRF